MRNIGRAQEEIELLNSQKKLNILAGARVIGCTTSGAVLHKSLLDSVSPGVVMLEEAAEIMETLVLTAVPNDCKHLIMIGDHKQLRPKVEHYPLSVESGKGHDLNCSMFERLARTIKVPTLSTQWRMHPEIAMIPKVVTYPSLRNADVTSLAPAIRGIMPCDKGGGRVIFIDHREPEDARDALAASQAQFSAKTNSHEVGMVVSTVQYLCQQGYDKKSMVVLTPYLGQLLMIQNALSKSLEVFVDDVDMNEARKLLADVAGFNVGGKSSKPDESVRIATVDNFQGEEADIVIISLVRSNKDNNIGFVVQPNRVNVMLSRAKHCQIIIGNSEVMQNAKSAHGLDCSGGPLWTVICEHLVGRKSMFPGLPIQCATHHNNVKYMTCPDDFKKHCPEGGCSDICGKKRACGHFCSHHCHPIRKCESLGKCKAKLEEKCSNIC